MNKPLSDYPDDIHQYDDHPQSPFYKDEPLCPICNNNEFYCECEEEDTTNDTHI